MSFGKEEVLSAADKAKYRSLVGQKMFQTMQAPRLGTTKKVLGKAAIDWARGVAANPRFATKASAVAIEEYHFIMRLGSIFLMSLPLCFLYFKKMSANNNTFAKDIRTIFNDSYTGSNTSTFSAHKDPINGLGLGMQTIDLNGRARYAVEREAFMFKKSLSKPKATAAPWSNIKSTDAENVGITWDPKLDAEYASAKKMLAELEEAKKIGGHKGRDEWVSHYTKRFNDKLPLPRQWWSVFASVDAKKHPILLLEDEMPWYSHTFRPLQNMDRIREMGEHPYEEFLHQLHHLDKYMA